MRCRIAGPCFGKSSSHPWISARSFGAASVEVGPQDYIHLERSEKPARAGQHYGWSTKKIDDIFPVARLKHSERAYSSALFCATFEEGSEPTRDCTAPHVIFDAFKYTRFKRVFFEMFSFFPNGAR
jgi:hypothetical protein